MHLTSKKTSLLLLGITAIACSRALFSLFNDPEGPNLLIVMGMAVIIYAVSFAAYTYHPSTKQDSLKKFLRAIFIQILLVIGFYFFLK